MKESKAIFKWCWDFSVGHFKHNLKQNMMSNTHKNISGVTNLNFQSPQYCSLELTHSIPKILIFKFPKSKTLNKSVHWSGKLLWSRGKFAMIWMKATTILILCLATNRLVFLFCSSPIFLKTANKIKNAKMLNIDHRTTGFPPKSQKLPFL